MGSDVQSQEKRNQQRRFSTRLKHKRRSSPRFWHHPVCWYCCGYTNCIHHQDGNSYKWELQLHVSDLYSISTIRSTSANSDSATMKMNNYFPPKCQKRRSIMHSAKTQKMANICPRSERENLGTGFLFVNTFKRRSGF